MSIDDELDETVEEPEEDVKENSVKLRVDVTLDHDTHEYLLAESEQRNITIEDLIAEACYGWTHLR